MDILRQAQSEDFATIVGKVFSLTPRELEVFMLLYEGGDEGCHDFPVVGLRTQIFNIRQKLMKFNIEVQAIGKVHSIDRGGYRIPPQSRRIVDLYVMNYQLSVVEKVTDEC